MRIFYALLLSSFLFACHNDDGDGNDPFSQSPYKAITDSISDFPNRADLYYRRGVVLYQNDQLAYAKQDFQKAWELAPREDYALSLTTVLKKISPDSAIIFLQNATLKIPQSIALQVGLARGYQNKGELDKALVIANQIIQQFPGQLDALTIKSEILASKNDKTGALASLEKAYSMAPSDLSLAYDLAYAYADAKEPKALILTDSLLKVKAEESEKAWYIKGVFYTNTGQANKALKSFDNSIKLNYNFLDAYRDKGQVLYNEKRFKEALQTFTLALKIAPASADFYYLLGNTQHALGNDNEAKLNYLRAYGLDKSLTDAKEAADKL